MARRVKITEDEVWAEIDKYFQAARKQEDEYTTDHFAERYGVSKSTARRRLAVMVKDGVLSVRSVWMNHGTVNVYKFSKKK